MARELGNSILSTCLDDDDNYAMYQNFPKYIEIKLITSFILNTLFKNGLKKKKKLSQALHNLFCCNCFK